MADVMDIVWGGVGWDAVVWQPDKPKFAEPMVCVWVKSLVRRILAFLAAVAVWKLSGAGLDGMLWG